LIASPVTGIRITETWQQKEIFMLRLSMTSLLFFSLLTSSLAQQGPPTSKQTQIQKVPTVSPQARPQTDLAKEVSQDEVVKLGVTLVQVDAVVTDKNGKQVTDLTADDFEIYEDGRKQKITNFSYVVTQTKAAPALVAEKNERVDATVLPPVRLRPEQVRRTIALVVDDLGLSVESFEFVRQSLRKFVDEQMQPGDLAAVIRTGAGRGVLQQFTSDKRQLHTAIERVRWNPSSRGGVSAVAAIGTDDALSGGSGGGDDSESTDSSKRADGRLQNDVDKFRDDIFAVGTLDTLTIIAHGLKDFPGRKSVVLFSDGLTLFSHTGDDNTRVLERVRRLIDAANRASVVFYAIDSRGLQTLEPTAADNFNGRSPRFFRGQLQKRRADFYDSQEGLIYLAKQTGGLSFLNSNDLSKSLARTLEDQKGYYLIGYVPDDATFKTLTGAKTFHNLSLKVKRKGLEARFRTGFYGVPESVTPSPTARTKQEQLHNAISSPFTSGGIPLNLTTLFGYEENAGLFISSMLHIDVGALTFTDDDKGMKQAVIDVGAVTFKDAAQVVDQTWKNYVLSIPLKNFENIKKNGLVYTIILPVKQAGAYQLRTVVLDTNSGQLGSANQFIEVPDVSKGHLAISGITTQGRIFARESQNQASQDDDLQNSPALRRIHSGSMMDYGFWIYNAQLDKTTNLPSLEVQTLLLKDGKVVYTGKNNPVEIDAAQSLKKIMAGGSLNFINFEPGEYVLQVIVTDKLAKTKNNRATQWIDFEIVK
jgi:VWFA-related protein